MHRIDPVVEFYSQHLPGAELKQSILLAECPFCKQQGKTGQLVVFVNPESYFFGYYRCLQRCTPGGFPLHFARQSRLNLSLAPGFDPDRDYTASKVNYPIKNLNNEVLGFMAKLTADLISRFVAMGISKAVLEEMQIGFNGRYLVYPYLQEDGNCHAARCVHPERAEDVFWHGNEDFAGPQFRIFNLQEIMRCENGSLIIVEGEDNLLTLRQLGLPGIALASAADFVHVEAERLAWLKTIFVCVNKNPESESAARDFAGRLGYKVRMIRWPDSAPKHYSLTQLATEQGNEFQKAVFTLIREAKSFSPFSSPEREFLHFEEQLNMEGGEGHAAMRSGFAKLDQALGGMHGINIMGGLPKAGKSCFFIQVASEMARRKIPVIYYDFENGRQKIYQRSLCRLSRLSVEQIRDGEFTTEENRRLRAGKTELQRFLPWFRVVTDRRLTPELMRSHLDFLRHETGSEHIMVVIDSLHKLPFKDLSERRSGIDAWLRQLESFRDQFNASFLVISELTRREDGQYDKEPQLGSFKGSGDIEYSADNAMVLLPQWDPFTREPAEQRRNDLWLVASREHSPGLVASYQLDYPYWGFVEK
ncbi:DnaB-like helicase C-terminal domain-containing protein [Candidatus Electronema sp. PJ]|uniref:DnaB-like helicase C-terminal domain-containing protein n=1 Tax=Candidatus Electronema sp. PJ TaxID=3401572 RepID=UPI003AA9C28A